MLAAGLLLYLAYVIITVLSDLKQHGYRSSDHWLTGNRKIGRDLKQIIYGSLCGFYNDLVERDGFHHVCKSGVVWSCHHPKKFWILTNDLCGKWPPPRYLDITGKPQANNGNYPQFQSNAVEFISFHVTIFAFFMFGLIKLPNQMGLEWYLFRAYTVQHCISGQN